MVTLRRCTVTIVGGTAYSASRCHESPKNSGETEAAYDLRTWREKMHVKDGRVVIPPMAFKQAVDRACQLVGRQIKGKGKATYHKFFKSGVMVLDPVPVADEADIQCERVYCNADGVRGSGKRVWRNYPRIDEWAGEVVFEILADEITKEVFQEAVEYAGHAVGVGRFRPENGGWNGRFRVKSFRWS